ncbi:MAG: class I SAM-dependent methyltransferase [Wenzhouxiangellaceae bacterium]
MNTVQTHYDNHLGLVYSWMAGGMDHALERGAGEIDSLELLPRRSGIAVDLGAGFGMHAIALAERGFEVLAVDSCRALIVELEERKRALAIRTVHDTIESFRAYLTGRPELILCMGDTLTHLDSEPIVQTLVQEVADAMEPGGRFIATFRDYSQALEGERRFIPVRADTDRILTCFLEYSERYVAVHDILHKREAADWKMSVSAYRKLRIAPEEFGLLLTRCGFAVELAAGPAGMVQFSAVLR